MVMSMGKHTKRARCKMALLAPMAASLALSSSALARIDRPVAPASPFLGMTVAACPKPPKPVRDLDIPRFYADAEGSKTDPELERLHAAAVEPLVDFVREIVDAADKAARGNTERGRCALEWLVTWARGEAWLGNMVTRQAEYQRKWDLAGIALAYIKLRPMARPERVPAFLAWAMPSLTRSAMRSRRPSTHSSSSC